MDDNGVKYYEMYGPLFFASVKNFKSKFDFDDNADEIVFDFLESKVIDYEGAKALILIIEDYLEKDKRVKVRYINSDMKRLLVKQEIDVEIVDNDEDPNYTMLIDELS